MKKYDIYGFHCHKCGEDYIKWINEKMNTDKIDLDYSKGTISVPDDFSMEELQRLLSFNKLYLDTNCYKCDNKDKNNDNHDHDHGHSHGHIHSHVDVSSSSARMAIVFFINLIFAIGEFIFASLFNSTAILSDAIHDLGDSMSIGLALLFEKKSEKHADNTHTFGYGRYSTLAALITSIFLIVGGLVSLIIAIPRLFNPPVVNNEGMFWLAIFAIIINGVSAFVLNKGSSLNESLMSIHVLEDLFGWVGILIVSFVLKFTDLYILDPILSIIIALWILYSTIPQFIKVIKVFLNASLDEDMYDNIYQELMEIDGLTNISHLHIWSEDGERTLVNVTISTNSTDIKEIEDIKMELRNILFYLYEIEYSTIEVLYDPNNYFLDYPFNLNEGQ